MRGGFCGAPMGGTYTLHVAMYDAGVVKVFQPFSGVRELEGAQYMPRELQS